MAKFVTLKQIMEDLNPPHRDPEPTDTDLETGEDDGLTQPADARSGRLVRSETDIDWKPNTISVDAIRNFYPRKGGRTGCRVMMKTGVAYVVLDTHEEIIAKIGA
jgi:hypothetical protein